MCSLVRHVFRLDLKKQDWVGGVSDGFRAHRNSRPAHLSELCDGGSIGYRDPHFSVS